jgi:hypothetical protein
MIQEQLIQRRDVDRTLPRLHGDAMTQRFCTWCGTAVPTAGVALDQEARWRCENCLKLNETEWGERTLQRCNACAEGYGAGGGYCPYCAAESSVSPPSGLQKMGLRPAPFQPLWPMKSWWEEDGRGLIAPPCPKCGQPVRPPNSGAHHEPGEANPPWNAGWDGRCAACGFTFALHIEQQLHFKAKRTVIVRPGQLFCQTFIDEGMQFSGVTIEVLNEPFYGPEEVQWSKVFLSMGELMALVQALQKEQRVWMEQYDWSCDWT